MRYLEPQVSGNFHGKNGRGVLLGEKILPFSGSLQARPAGVFIIFHFLNFSFCITLNFYERSIFAQILKSANFLYYFKCFSWTFRNHHSNSKDLYLEKRENHEFPSTVKLRKVCLAKRKCYTRVFHIRANGPDVALLLVNSSFI